MSEYNQPQYEQAPGMRPAPPAPPYYPAAAPVPRTNTLAIVSLISSFFVGLVGIITGHMALRQIKRTGEGGRGMALAGTIIGYVTTAMTALAAILLVASLFFGLAIFGTIFAAASQSDPIPNLPTPTEVEEAPYGDPTGIEGAWNYDEGYMFLGSGPVIVDYFFDPMCPGCGQFEATNGETLAGAVDAGAITLRLHPMNFLDPTSLGTDYSTRASAALSCVAQQEPERTSDFMIEMFAQQPAEGTEGLSDDELAALLPDLNDATSWCISPQQPFVPWIRDVAEANQSGETTSRLGLPSVTGTPTVFVDGVAYTGPNNDAAAFEAFLGGK